MEKEPDSMATVQMKQEYAASEVYSTAGSEGPPVSEWRYFILEISKKNLNKNICKWELESSNSY